MIELLRRTWEAHPDLRLGQLIEVANDKAWQLSREAPTVFITEDYLMAAGLRRMVIEGHDEHGSCGDCGAPINGGHGQCVFSEES